MIQAFLIALYFLLLFSIRPITVLIHELGHLLPVLLFTRGPADIYIGSFGDREQSKSLQIGRVQLHFHANPLVWTHGLCSSKEPAARIEQQMIIIAGGPLFSLLAGALAFSYYWMGPDHGILNFLGCLYGTSAVVDFYSSVRLKKTPIKLADGRIIYNDGVQFRNLYRQLQLPKAYQIGNQHYHKQEFLEAGQHYLKVFEAGFRNHQVFKMALLAFIQAKAYPEALQLYADYGRDIDLDADDLTNMGLLHSTLKDGVKSHQFYQKALQLNPENIYALNNRGYQYMLDEDFEQALEDLNTAIRLDKNMSYAWCNRGLLKLKTGQPEAALEDLLHSLQLNAENPYVYRNLGMYYLHRADKEQALQNLQQAYALDPETEDVATLLAEAEGLAESR